MFTRHRTETEILLGLRPAPEFKEPAEWLPKAAKSVATSGKPATLGGE